MWAFFILATVYLEAYGSLLKLLFHGGSFEEGEHLSWAIPLVGHWALLGFIQDFIAVMALLGLVTFYWIRLRNQPKQLGRKSRFFGSHLGPAYLTLFMIFNVIWTMFLFRGAGAAQDPPETFPYESGAFVSLGVGKALERAVHRRARGARGRRPAAAHRRDAGLPDLRAELQAPAHLPGPAQRALRPPPGRARRDEADDGRRQARSTSRTSRTSTRTRCSASARSRTSPGRACSTSPPAPSAAAARASAPPGTPRSRSRPSC